ncbi:MAG: M6 family metalloprotease domain-containing protein [Muribaculaceae bacterium]|nr:M6 family metalloprotease domain-containing protein [Muribaculaceae bacterium]
MRLKNLIATTAFAALPLFAAARPASPELMRHVNPDGTTVEFRLYGNEHFSYMTDAQGVSILEYDRTGRLAPAMRDGIVLHANEATITRLQAEQPEITMPGERKIARMADLEPFGENKGRTTFPSIGENVRACVILMEFPDRPFISADPQKLFNDLCNKEGYDEYGSMGSARDYYRAVSNGKFVPQFDVYGPVKLEHEADWYCNIAADDPILEGLNSAQRQVLAQSKQPRFGYAIYEAMQALQDKVDFSVYDFDNNGEIDNVFFFYSGWGQADTGDKSSVWPHQSDYRGYCPPYTLGTIFKLPPIYVNGKQLTCYATSCELNSSPRIPAEDKPWVDGIGAFCHEFAHVLGLPDLYDTSGSGCKTPGTYSIMDQGSYNMLSTCPPTFSAYEQWVCKWLEYDDAEAGEVYTLNPLTADNRSCMRLRIPLAGGAGYSSEYYVFESRNNDGWDASLPEQGIFIWRINFSNSVWADNSVNSGASPRVEMIGKDSRNFAWYPEDDETPLYIVPDMKVIVPTSTRQPYPAYISKINYDWDTGVGYLEYNKNMPLDEAPVLYTDSKKSAAKREVYLNWSEMPGMDYMLTVTRTDDAGREYIVDGLDNALILGSTSRTVRNITATQWKQKFKAYVRAFNGVPGKAISNIHEFVPDELEEGVGVTGVSVDLPVIYGGRGCVVAPEGSKVYNMSGIECGMYDLPAGIYIVVADGVTAKVTVR